MKVSRAPEKRGGVSRNVVYLALIIGAVVIGILITYLATGFESRAATGDQTGLTGLASDVSPAAGQLELTPIAPATATPVPTVALKLVESDPEPAPKFIPDVRFGEVLAEGFVDVNLPGNKIAESWYTFQVDTVSRDITLFFAVYNDSGNSIIRTVKIRDYSQGSNLENAEITVFYPEGPERTLLFDGNEGTVTLTQQIQQPYGPSLFSPELRVALVNQRMVLQDESGDISAELQLDLTGLSDSEVLVFKRSAPDTVDEVLAELKNLVNQIEAKRVR